MTAVRRRTPSAQSPTDEVAVLLAEYLPLVRQEKLTKERAAPLKEKMMALLQRHGSPDDKASLWIELPAPFMGVQAIKRERRVSTTLNTDVALDVLKDAQANPRLEDEDAEQARARRTLVRDCFQTTVTFDGSSEGVLDAIKTGIGLDQRVVDYSQRLVEERIMQAYAVGMLTAQDLEQMFTESVTWAFKAIPV